MINLLPPDLKQEYRYARQNLHILRWTYAFVFVIAGVAVITLAGTYTMNRSSDTYKARITNVQDQLAKEDSAGIERQVTAISNNLKLMVSVLSKEVLFSELLARLGSLTPSNAVLTNLSIAQNVSAIDITAQTTDYNAATQLQVNLADAGNQIFSKADIVTISCADGATAANPAYPCTVQIRAAFTSDNPFLFLNAKGSN